MAVGREEKGGVRSKKSMKETQGPLGLGEAHHNHLWDHLPAGPRTPPPVEVILICSDPNGESLI